MLAIRHRCSRGPCSRYSRCFVIRRQWTRTSATMPSAHPTATASQSSGSAIHANHSVGGTSASSPAFAGMMALVNQKYGRQGQANFILYPLKQQFPAAFHDVTHGTNSVPCAFSPSSPNCTAVANPFTVNDPINGTAIEGQMGAGTTPAYNAAAGYNLATGLGTIDATQIVTTGATSHLPQPRPSSLHHPIHLRTELHLPSVARLLPQAERRLARLL